MDIIPVPTLSDLGWVTSIADKIDILMTDMLSSQYSQSLLYYGNITSLSKLIAEFDQNVINLENNMTDAFKSYLTGYFPEGVEVTVTAEEPNDKKDNRLNIKTSIYVVQDNKKFDVGYLLEYEGTNFKKFQRLNNGGVN